MFVLFKEDGKVCVRPAYIGFIKNNLLRRGLMVVTSPLTLSVVILLNILKAVGILIIHLVDGIGTPLLSFVKSPAWKSKYWYAPRVKEDISQ